MASDEESVQMSKLFIYSGRVPGPGEIQDPPAPHSNGLNVNVKVCIELAWVPGGAMSWGSRGSRLKTS